jgi:hypothetical protein
MANLRRNALAQTRPRALDALGIVLRLLLRRRRLLLALAEMLIRPRSDDRLPKDRHRHQRGPDFEDDPSRHRHRHFLVVLHRLPPLSSRCARDRICRPRQQTSALTPPESCQVVALQLVSFFEIDSKPLPVEILAD